MKTKFEVSCDDGSKLDFKLIKLLKKYNLPCTFYLFNYCELDEDEVRKIAEDYEIGGHTLTHQILTNVDLETAYFEITEGKKRLESIIGREITKFCYPRGYYNEDIKNLVKKAGFKEARTTRILWTTENEPFEKHTTIHVFQNPNYGETDWLEKALEILKSKPKYYSLWLHTKEVERDNNWGKLEILFKKLNESISRSK